MAGPSNREAPASRDSAGRGVVTFKTLVMVAGASNPKQAFYADRLRPLCATYGFNCQSDARMLELAVVSMNGESLDTYEPKLPQVASASPEDLYVDAMTSCHASVRRPARDPAPYVHLLPHSREEEVTAMSDLLFRRRARASRAVVPTSRERSEAIHDGPGGAHDA